MTSTRVGLLVLVTIAAVVLVGAALRGVNATRDIVSDDQQAFAEQVDQFFTCLDTELESRVPAHAKVYLAVKNALVYQRLGESTYPRYTIVSRPGDADYVVDVGDVGDVFDHYVPPVGCGRFEVTDRATGRVVSP